MAVSTQKTLVGWKAIAGYFSRDERTVMRWAASRGMPVQRVAGQARSSVYAWPDDLDAWLGRSSAATFAPVPDPVPTPPPAMERTPPVATRPALRNLLLVAAALLFAVLVAAGAWWLAMPQHDAPVADAPGPAFHDPSAKASYLQASFDWNLRTRESLLRAALEYGDAVTRDPGVAASYIGLANTYLLLREYAAMPDAVAYARAGAAAKVAVGIDPHSMEARRTLAFIAFWWRGDIATAGREFAQAIALAPQDPLTHHWLATALAANGEREAALREIATARTLDPTSSATLVDYAMIAYAAGHRDESARIFRTLLAANPDDAALHRDLAAIAILEGRYRDYLTAAARSAALRDDDATARDIAGQAADFTRGGAPLMFEHMVDTARNRTLSTNAGYFTLAQVSAISARGVAAIDALAPACERREHTAIAAPGDLWLARVVSADTMRRLCPRPSLSAAVAGANPAV